MGFLVLQPKYQPYAGKLRIREHPLAGELVSLLQRKPPSSVSEATSWFRLLASRVNGMSTTLACFVDSSSHATDFRTSDLERLSTTLFVPITGEKGAGIPAIRWLPPSQCYLRGETKESFHSKLFTFVDYGPSANAFLTACGTRNQPSVEEIARILLDDPRHFFELSAGPMKSVQPLFALLCQADLTLSASLLSSVISLSMQRVLLLGRFSG